jgi:hypothetical protein
LAGADVVTILIYLNLARLAARVIVDAAASSACSRWDRPRRTDPTRRRVGGDTTRFRNPDDFCHRRKTTHFRNAPRCTKKRLFEVAETRQTIGY